MSKQIAQVAWAQCKEVRMTDTEIQVAHRLVLGFTSKRIAQEMGFSDVYVRMVTSAIYARLRIGDTGGRNRRFVAIEMLRGLGLG